MAKVSLQRPRIVALVGQRKATGVSKHVGVSLEAQLGLDARALHHASKAASRERRVPLGRVNTNGDFGSCSRCNLRRARISSPRMGWVARHAFLGPTNVQDGMGEIHLIPVQVREFGRSETVAEGDKDHGGCPDDPSGYASLGQQGPQVLFDVYAKSHRLRHTDGSWVVLNRRFVMI